ncbi:cytidylate kinase-like family protein [Niameybacter massiliensis]|uniref:Cytidylate kinase-like family protein n=1 Tax=Holtiella tumoricola TaxID=3018743 RepID=A0AA42J1W9_9FIRM|nr:cytidylate kinase-like family protein [Holtiella tumoricola]MDA3733067.1 cytidylate kinase-like family protein [Holtiella tumoricola]
MKNFVITIARGYGSGGRTIGKMLAADLDIPYYDRNLLRLASDDSGINEQLFIEADEKVKNTLLYKVAKNVYKGEIIPPDRDDFVSNENLFNYQAKIIKELAMKESCVIIGRCADYILKDDEQVISVYIHAPLEACIQGVEKIAPVKNPKQYILTTDKRRAAYYHYFTGQDWKDANNYDLCLDSSALGYEKCIEVIKAYLKIKRSE